MLPCYSYDHKDIRFLSLLRYNKNLFGYKSEVDSKEYFYHKDGKTNPEMELSETLKRFSEDKKNLCDFPARAILLAEMNLMPSPDLNHCQKYNELKNKLNLSKVSLIFSSYFMEKPASAFGHTFFKLRSSDSVNEDNDLLDYGVDFSAQVTTLNPILYGIMGILGGFDGKFKLMPYYYKIREYNDMESRDLWSYDLNFNKRDLDMFVAHLVEMERASFDYYYTGENCSYHILGFINAIRPDWKLMDYLGAFVPPVQTIYALYENKDIVTGVTFRPSLSVKVRKQFSMLNSNEKNIFLKTSKTNDYTFIKIIDDQKSKSNLIEILSDYYDFKNANILLGEKDDHYKKVLEKKFEINLLRSQLNQKPAPLDYDHEYKNAPHLGHKTRRYKMGYLWENHKNGAEIEYKFSLHDFLDDSVGWIPFSTTEIGRINARFLEKGNTRLDRFSLINVDALKPVSHLSFPTSWRFTTGITDQRFTPKQDICPYLDLALGLSYQHSYFNISTFIKSEQSFIFNNSKHYRLGLGPEVLFIYNNKKFITSFEINRLKIINQADRYNTRYIVNARYNLNQNFGIYLKDEKKYPFKNAYSAGFVNHF